MMAHISSESRLTMLSPLRYPGSKYLLVDYFQTFLRANEIERPHLFEPFAGGASLSLVLLQLDKIERATWVERDPLIYAFWKCIKRCPDELCERIWKLDVSIRTWKKYQRFLHDDALSKFSVLDLGIAGLFFNRANFSGIISAKPIGGMSQSSDYNIDCRFNPKTLVDRICNIAKYRERISVCYGDGVSFMMRNRQRIANLAKKNNVIIYVDPPYYQQGPRLYRHHFLDKDHNRLAEFMNRMTFPWLVSYDNCQRIKDLFASQKILPIYFKYTVKKNRRADELLITNQRELPIPALQPADFLQPAVRAAIGF